MGQIGPPTPPQRSHIVSSTPVGGSAYRHTSSSGFRDVRTQQTVRSEEHTSELQSLMRISYAVFCLKKKNTKHKIGIQHTNQPTLTVNKVSVRTHATTNTQ